MEHKRKRPNFFDLLLIVLVLAAAAAAYALSHGGMTDQAPTLQRSYVLELGDLREELADQVQVGDAVQDTVKNYDLGTVTAVEVVPYTIAALDEAGGVIRQAPVEGKCALHLTITVDTQDSDNAVNTVSGFTLRVGTPVNCQVGTLVGSGYVLALDR